MADLYEIAVKLSEALPFLKDTDALKKEAESYKPLPKETEDRILQKFRLEWNYHSNAIEGNKLTYGETVAFIMEGLTAKGKPLKDHLDIQGHDEAVKYLTSLVKDAGYILTEADIRGLHKMILKESYWADAITADGSSTKKEIKVGQYKSSSNSVKTPTGEMHYYATPEDTPIRMGELMDFYKQAKAGSAVHPLVLAALFHHEFVAIHPFDDGNGRMTRLITNLMLMQAGYPPIVVKQEDRLQYYQVLRQADAGEYIPVIEYMSNLLQHSLDIYIKGAKGESIEEESDIDKEIALFKKGLGEDKITLKKSQDIVERTLNDTIIVFFESLFKKFDSLKSLFVAVSKSLTVTYERYDPIVDQVYGIISEPYLIESDFRANMEEIIAKEYDYDFFSFRIEMLFEGYKKSWPTFSMNLEYTVNFSDYTYKILSSSNQNLLIENAYGKHISTDKVHEIVKQEIRIFLDSLSILQ